MTVSFTAEAEGRIAGSHEDIRVGVSVDGTVSIFSLDGEGRARLALMLSMTDLALINQFATRAIKAMEAAKTEVEGG